MPDQNLPRLIAARMANISLEHGHTDGSCMAHMWFGQLLIARFNDYQPGLRFGKLGLDLGENAGPLLMRRRIPESPSRE